MRAVERTKRMLGCGDPYRLSGRVYGEVSVLG
jgi:hypothetical protein